MSDGRFSVSSRATQVAEFLMHGTMAGLGPGDALPPVRQLADRLGVSVPTVREAQKCLAKSGYLTIRQGRGVFMAQAPRPRRIALVSELDLLHPRSSSFFAGLVRALRRFFEERNCQVEFFMGATEPGVIRQQPSCGRFMTEAASRQLDAAVLVNMPETLATKAFIRDCPIPLVGAGTPFLVGVDYPAMAREAFCVLAGQGGRRVAVMGGPPGIPVDRLAAGHGLEVRPEWIRHDLHPMWSGAGWEEFREIWTRPRTKPDSLLILDDGLLPDAFLAILELGIPVPRQLRIAAHANFGTEPRNPFPLTLLRTDPAWCADCYGEMILQRLEGKPVAEGMRAVPILVAETEESKNVRARQGKIMPTVK